MDKIIAKSFKRTILFFMKWLGREDSNLRMTIPKTVALPLGDVPMYEFAVLMSFLRRRCYVVAFLYLRHPENNKNTNISIFTGFIRDDNNV